MTIEREIILSVLKLAKNEPVQKDLIAKDTHTSAAVANELLKSLHQKGLIQLQGKIIEIAPKQRLQLAIEAIKRGIDIERACRFLDWKEFENIAATAFEINRYIVKRNFRFKAAGKPWEIDLLANKQPRIICVDCKHWKHGWSKASITKTAEAQVERTKALASVLQNFTQKIGIENWTQATLIPIVLSLTPSLYKFHNNIPIIPILQLQSFISELPTQAHSLTCFSTILKEKNLKLTDF